MISEKDSFHQEVINLDNRKKGEKWKFFGIFILIIFTAFLFYSIYFKYLSPAVREERRLRESYEKYLEWEQNFKQTMREDTYGGKTPEETLALFIDALKKGDIELASRYFALDSPLSREEWRQKIIGKENELINIISNAVPTPDQEPSERSFWFSVYNNKGEVEQLVEMSFNTLSGAWKIQSL